MRKRVFLFYALVLSAIPLLVLMVLKKTIIISIGLSGFRLLKSIFLCILSLEACAFIFLFLFRTRKQAPKVSGEEVTKGRIDKEGIKKSLAEQESGKWRCIEDTHRLFEIMDSMDYYQESLAKLLLQASDLRAEKPMSIMERLEDSIYVNVKKLLNYMMVLQSSDAPMVHKKVAECVSKNSELLEKGKNFVVAVTDYVNRDMGAADEQRALDHMKSYMYMVLDAIEKQEYLN